MAKNDSNDSSKTPNQAASPTDWTQAMSSFQKHASRIIFDEINRTTREVNATSLEALRAQQTTKKPFKIERANNSTDKDKNISTLRNHGS